MNKSIAITFTAALMIAAGTDSLADQMTAMQSGCLGCHKADAKLVGPSFQDIARKYAGQEGIVDQLAATVKAGSQGGKWGDAVMPASPAPIEDIKKVISWMLTH